MMTLTADNFNFRKFSDFVNKNGKVFVFGEDEILGEYSKIKEEHVIAAEPKKDSLDDVMEDIWKTFKSDGHAVDRFLENKHRD